MATAPAVLPLLRQDQSPFPQKDSSRPSKGDQLGWETDFNTFDEPCSPAFDQVDRSCAAAPGSTISLAAAAVDDGIGIGAPVHPLHEGCGGVLDDLGLCGQWRYYHCFFAVSKEIDQRQVEAGAADAGDPLDSDEVALWYGNLQPSLLHLQQYSNPGSALRR